MSDQCSNCDGGGWVWPNLGVNRAPGDCWRGNEAVPCQVCNAYRRKLSPDEVSQIIADALHRYAGRQEFHHTLMFDGTHLVDTWNTQRGVPMKRYRVRPQQVEG